MLRLLALWVLLSLPIGIWARRRGRSGVTWLLLALLVSPLIAAVLLLAARNLAIQSAPAPGPTRKRRFFRIMLNIIMALAVIWIFFSLLNQGGMTTIRVAHLPPAMDVQASPSPAYASYWGFARQADFQEKSRSCAQTASACT